MEQGGDKGLHQGGHRPASRVRPQLRGKQRPKLLTHSRVDPSPGRLALITLTRLVHCPACRVTLGSGECWLSVKSRDEGGERDSKDSPVRGHRADGVTSGGWGWPAAGTASVCSSRGP